MITSQVQGARPKCARWQRRQAPDARLCLELDIKVHGFTQTLAVGIAALPHLVIEELPAGDHGDEHEDQSGGISDGGVVEDIAHDVDRGRQEVIRFPEDQLDVGDCETGERSEDQEQHHDVDGGKRGELAQGVGRGVQRLALSPRLTTPVIGRPLGVGHVPVLLEGPAELNQAPAIPHRRPKLPSASHTNPSPRRRGNNLKR